MTDVHGASKRAAARVAVDRLESGGRLGLGTGSTVAHALQRLAERIADEGFEVVGVPTSEDTAQRARALGIPLASLDEITELDVTIDGADEVDPERNLIKGGGGALTREKIVAAASRSLWIIVSDNKLVPHLGATFPLPVEILRFGKVQTERRVTSYGLQPTLRVDADGRCFETDNGNLVLDCALPDRTELRQLAAKLGETPGVVEHGLFLGMTERVFVGAADGSVRELS